jgi:hypothetical protein
MKYEKPTITTLDDLSAMEWAVPRNDHEQPRQVAACSKSNPAGCHCTSSQARVKSVPVSCHCTSGQSRVTYRESQ